MRRPDKGVTRFLLWIALATATSSLLYYSQLLTFFRLLDGKLDETFGTNFPAVPFVALLGVLFLIRWNDLHRVLNAEGPLTSKPATRTIGLALTLAPIAFATWSAESLELSAASLIMAFYGTSLALSPTTLRILFPYAALYLGGVTAPSAIQFFLGEPLAALSSSLSAGMLSLAGIPVSWQGTQFELVSRAGQTVSGVITPGCSSVLSVTTFLGLLGLMHFDLRKSLQSTLRMAVIGVAVLIILNSVRIGFLLGAGYYGGPDSLWSLHNWIGYAMFLGFYVVVLMAYSKMGTGRGAQMPDDGEILLPVQNR